MSTGDHSKYLVLSVVIFAIFPENMPETQNNVTQTLFCRNKLFYGLNSKNNRIPSYNSKKYFVYVHSFTFPFNFFNIN